jgi:exonuclease SbcD
VLRILHTSDWHLGHTLHDLPRDHEHARFLDWLLETLAAEQVDALLVAGDLFDVANPPARAVAAWFRFLAAARERLPRLDIVAIGGNHDSPSRLEAPGPLLRAHGVHIVGGLPRRAGPRASRFDSGLDVDRLLVPLRDRRGKVAAQVAAVPYLRPADLPPVADPAVDALIEGVRAVYTEVLDEARRRRRGRDQAIVALGHCYMVGTRLSRTSERRILGGNQHALPVDIFPDDVAYAALGHLHKAQRVGAREHIRYSGAPIPLALDEARYRNQVCIVDLDGGRCAGVRCVEVPRWVPLVRVPARGPAPLAEVLPLLAALEPLAAGTPEAERPFLEVRVSLPRPEPSLRRDVELALAGKAARLVKLAVSYVGDGRALADGAATGSLRELDPEQVFLRRYRRDHDGEPDPALLAAFHELLERAQEAAR